MHSIKTKIIFAYTLVFGTLFIVFAIIIYHSSKEAVLNKLDANLKSYSVSLQTEITEQLGEGNKFDMKELSSIHPQNLSGARCQLFNSKGHPLFFDSLLSTNFKFQSENISSEISFYKNISLNFKPYRILTTPFETMEDSLYILVAAASMNEAYEYLKRLLYLFLLLVPLGLLMTGFAAYLISRAAFRPITRIVNTVKDISDKSLDNRIELPEAKDEVRELAETLNEMIERLDNSFKSQRIFISNASHEIKTPLTVIQMHLESLKKKLNKIEDKTEVDEAMNEIDKLTKLTNSLLILEKLDSSQYKLNLEKVRIDELLAECVETIDKFAQINNLKINLLIFDAVELNADKDKLRSVFINLLDNAVKYSFPDSEIDFILHEPINNKIMISLENYGLGIKPLDIDHLFNRFYRSNEIRAKIKGSGLGLAIAKEIVVLHGGEIEVESNPGKKTVFSIILPINNVKLDRYFEKLNTKQINFLICKF